MPDDIFKPIQLELGEGRCKIALMLIDTGEGIQGLLTGGEQPHIGGCVLSVPRPSLTGEGWSVDLYITPVPNHKDVDVARLLAERLGLTVRKPIAITAGIHSDQLTSQELKNIQTNCSIITEQAIEIFNSQMPND